jgi:flagellar protein FliS
MNAVIDNALQTYARLAVETGVSGATPEMLIVMLYEGAILSLTRARAEMLAGDAAAKGRSISKAIGIVEEGLRGALDEKAGGEIAANLASLYEYMGHRLLQANLQDDTAALDEVCSLLRDLKVAWEDVVARQQGAAAESAPEPARGRGSNSYGKA